MFRLNLNFNVLKRILCVADDYKLSAVNLWTSQPSFQRRRRINEANPGLDKRLNLFRDENSKNMTHYAEDNIALADDDDDLQPYFGREKASFSTYEGQSGHERERLKRNIVKQRYFKTEKQPNFLTWAEKEQIRHLYSTDEVEWSTEKLSQSFPATETVIKKIIKSRWDHEDSKNVLRHDKTVQKNWKELLGGRLDIDLELKEHLMKFAKRNQAETAHVFLQNSNYIQNQLASVENVKGEFSQMVLTSRGDVSSSEQLQITSVSNHHVFKPNNSQETSIARCSNEFDTFVLGNNGGPQSCKPAKSSKLITLDQYKQALNLGDNNNEEIVSSERLQENQVQRQCPEESPQDNQVQRQAISFEQPTKDQLMLGRQKFDNSVYLQYPEHIKIPKNKWKEGGTYKSGDCYYDDDGEFLYRVPGMK